MAKNQKLIGGLAATALLMGSSALARRGTEKSWTMIAGKTPPIDETNKDVALQEAVAWALISGAVVGLTRLAVRRGLIFKGMPGA